MNILLKDHLQQLILLHYFILVMKAFNPGFSFQFNQMFQHKNHHCNNLKLILYLKSFNYQIKANLLKHFASF